MMKTLIKGENLLKSGVVANNRMNRGRGCLGRNSYQKDLSFDPVEFIMQRLVYGEPTGWLDIACGEGRALIEAANIFATRMRSRKLPEDLKITGVDLAGMFAAFSPELDFLSLLETPVEDFVPVGKFDLITCVHGLHYIGDKLEIIRKAAGWLKQDGLLIANLELKNLKLAGKEQSSRIFSAFLRKQNFTVDTRKNLISLKGRRDFEVPYQYLGGDEKAGANYTGQPVVNSYYKL